MPLDCLVINLTRFGDLIQSQPLLHELRSHGLKSGLVCQENFAGTLSLLSGLEKTFSFPGASLLAGLDRDWKEAYASLRTWSSELLKEVGSPFVLNLTATVPARLLSSLLAASPDQLVGFALDQEGFGANRGAWATFLCGTSTSRQNAVFNIADMFRKMATPILLKQKRAETCGSGLKTPDLSARTAAKALLTEGVSHAHLPSDTTFFAFQLGASSTARQWPVAHFARLGDILWKKAHICPVLTGTKNEASLQAEYLHLAKHPSIPAVGRTGLMELAALLKEVRLIVSNDTGTLHLAAGLGIPALAFFLATAQPWDTAPYLPGCLCLEPDLPCHPCPFQRPCPNNHHCRETIAPEPVAEILLTWLSSASWFHSVKCNPNISARIYETTRDNAGFADVRKLLPEKADDRTLWIREQRSFWRQLLDEEGGGTENATENEIFRYSSSFGQKMLPLLAQTVTLLGTLEEQISLLGRVKAAGPLFLRNCNRLETLFSSSPELVSFASFWKELRNDRGQDIPGLTQSLQRFKRHLSRIAEKIKNGMDSAY